MPEQPLIAFVDLVTSVGGVQTVMASVWPRLADRYRCAVIDAYGNPDYARLWSGTAVERVELLRPPRRRYIGGRGATRVLGLAARAPWLTWAALRLRRWVRTHRPSVVYFNQLPAFLWFSRAIPAATPVVYHAHGVGAVRAAEAPYVGRRSSRVVAVSRAVADSLARAGVDRDRIDVVYNGVDVDAERRVAAAGAALPDSAPGEVVLAHVGVLIAHKQQHVSIEALSRLPPHVTLWLCGSMPSGADPGYEASLRALAERLGVARRVHFLGWRDDVPHVISRADVVILPSVQEAMPRALVEAMAAGKPCVGAAVGGIPEIIEDGVTGRVVPPTAAEFAAALAPLATSASARRALGEAGARRAARLFTLEAQQERLAAVLASAMGGPARRRPRAPRAREGVAS
ncbi:glycosyltransferase [Anaeromyxobacter diazotrophicus]|uniref:Glycosyl transferase group 1 n=1 Tax=Anaeromyxobacter diazotrophicus TaxID=2590199 RepID=A0A7I9VPK4_9BACT|nr:glycosyltransferase [Anaeromyxobacter diazotrophicus]GEJ58168.1 hypothetical protein AMYX_29090 [Anaeromyxobacter diazotrophicus]